ncbi:PAS domain S-box protein [Aquiflexum sp.]|uniref:PAS domain S-box protein n=1 Tax=Aquiflexum sp. TaxID=1872584 RepID=UPI0035933868
MYCVSRDAKDKIEEEAEKELLRQISLSFNDEEELIPAAYRLCENLYTFGKFDLIELWCPNMEQTQIKLIGHSTQNQYFYELEPSETYFQKNEGLPGKVWEKGKQLLWDEKQIKKYFIRKKGALHLGLQAILGIPLTFKDELVGVLLIGTKREPDYLEQHSLVLSRLEKFIGSEINRKRLENDLRNVFDATPEILCVTDFEGRFLKINNAGCALLGYAQEEVLFHSIDEFTLIEDKGKFEQKIKGITKGDSVFTFENRFLAKDEQVIWLSWNCNPALEDGLVYASAKNITDRIKSEISLQASLKSLEDYKFALDQTAIITITDTKGVITSVNDQFCKLSKYSREELIGKTHSIINSKHHPKSFFAELWGTIAKGKVFRGEIKNQAKDGSFYWVDSTIVPFLDENNKPFQYVAIRIDITAKKLANEKIIEILEEKNNILESIGDGFFAVNKDWTVTYWNKKAETILGRNKEDVLGKNIWETHPDVIDSEFYRQYHKAMLTGETINFEENYATLDLWVEVTVYPSENGLSIYFKDISYRKKTDILLLKANERFEKVTQATNDAIWDWNISENTLFWGEGFKTLFGYDVENITPTLDSWIKNIYPSDIERVEKSVYEAIKNKNVSNWLEEYRYKKSDNSFAYVIDKGVIIRDSQGVAVRMVGAMVDFTKLKEQETKLVELNESLKNYAKELERSNEELEQFAFVTSHDLQEPLRMISSFMDQLKRKYADQLDDKALQYIHYATEGAKRMKQIILDLLLYSRANKAFEEKEEVDLNEILSDFKQLRRKLIAEKSATIISRELPHLRTFSAPVTQIFHSLLDNALKYSKENIPLHIEISTIENGTEWEFAIKDNGIGIDNQFFDKIFIIFQRLHNRELYSGTGIGLSIAKRSVEFMGGRIWLNSEVGQGSIFHFTIPKN